MNITLYNQEVVKHVGDTTAITAAMAAFFELLPAVIANVSAVCALIYLLIRIYETKTMQKLLRRMKRK